MENDEGVGPYCAGGPSFDDLWHHQHSYAHPRPTAGGEPWHGWAMDFDYIYGFTSIAQYKDWFSAEDIETLYYRGFSMRSYEVAEKDIRRGVCQCAFLRLKEKDHDERE
jgi:hypothetical protein